MQKYFIKGKGCTHLRVCHDDDLILEEKIETSAKIEFLSPSPLPSPLPFLLSFLSVWHCPKPREIPKNKADKIPLPHEACFLLKKQIQQTNNMMILINE